MPHTLTHTLCPPNGVRGVRLYAVLVQKGLQTPGETQADVPRAEVFS